MEKTKCVNSIIFEEKIRAVFHVNQGVRKTIIFNGFLQRYTKSTFEKCVLEFNENLVVGTFSLKSIVLLFWQNLIYFLKYDRRSREKFLQDIKLGIQFPGSDNEKVVEKFTSDF